MNGQRLDASEPYFVHIGYTHTRESMIRSTKKVNHRYVKLKMRPVVVKRLTKLKKYWMRSLQ